MYSTVKSMPEDYKCARYYMKFLDNKYGMNLQREKNSKPCPNREGLFFYNPDNFNSFIYSPDLKGGK